MALQLDFSNAEAQRLRITQEQQRKIQELYKQASAEIARQAGKAPRVPSDALRKSYLNTLQGQIDERLRDIEAQLNGTVRSSMTAAAAATVGDAKQFLQQNGLSIRGAYSHVPADIVNAVASGQLYSGNWTLSRALWLNTKETQQDVQNIVAQGIIQNKSAFEIAKDLERYVDPTAKKDWDWSKVYPGTRRKIDYNAQRLARTMVSHAYQQAFVRTTQKNPFVKKYKWEASNSERTCELCEERNGQLFDKDDLPLDHPNGMCTFTAVMDDMDTIGERLGDWAAGKDDPELDQWANDLFGTDYKEVNNPYPNEMETKGYVGLSGPESDKFMAEHHNDKIIAKDHLNTMNGAQARSINRALRRGEMPTDPKDLAMMKRLDKAISQNSLPQDMTLFRGVGVSEFRQFEAFKGWNPPSVPMEDFKGPDGKIDFAAWGIAQQKASEESMLDLLMRGKTLVGETVTDKGFLQVSASSERNIFQFSDINIQLHVPQGTHAYISDYREESEIILARGTRYEILGAEISTQRAENGVQKEVLQLIARVIE